MAERLRWRLARAGVGLQDGSSVRSAKIPTARRTQDLLRIAKDAGAGRALLVDLGTRDHGFCVGGEVVDHRADLYSLGVTLYQLVTGSVPFQSGDVTYHHRHTAPQDPRERVAEIPAGLAELLLQMLAKQPDDRVQSAAEVAERLRGVANEA